MTMRPGQAKGPNVALMGAPAAAAYKVKVTGVDPVADYLAPSLVAGAGIALATIGGGVDEKVEITCTITDTDIKAKVSATDTTTDYLDAKIVAGTGITKTKLNSPGNETLEIKVTTPVDYKVKVSAADTTANYLDSKVAVGQGMSKQILSPAGVEVAEFQQEAGPAFHDMFTTSRPFWMDTAVITSADWSVDTVNKYLKGLAANNAYDWYRIGMSGDFDHAMKVDINGATSTGFQFIGNSKTISLLKILAGTITRASATGKSDVDVVVASATEWLRVRRNGSTLDFWYKVLDTDPWTLIVQYTDVDLGSHITAYLKSGTNAHISPVYFIDNTFPERVRSDACKEIPMTDQATIAVDASYGNLYTVTLAASRTMGNPTNPMRAQKIMFRIKQGGSGSYTITWDTKYRFSTDLPSPTLSTAVGKIDYIGFLYNEADDKWDCVGKVFGF